MAATARGSTMKMFVRTCRFLGLAIALAIAADGCRDATQVTLVISTSPKVTCGGLRGVQLAVAGGAGKAEELAAGEFVTATATCPDPAAQEVGTLVVTPGASGGMAVVVVAGIRNDARSCKSANHYDGCVVARRSLSFRDHVSATVPIIIDPKCVDVPCDVSSTCNRGACISSAVECADDGSCASVDPRGREDEDAGGPGTNDGSSDAPQGDAPMDGPANDAPMSDGGTDADEGGIPGACLAYCAEASGPCPAPTACCYGATDTNMPVQTCLATPAECSAGGNGRMAGGVAECCRDSYHCGGNRCCLTADNKRTVCRASCNAGEVQLCSKSTECANSCMPAALGGPYASLSACQ